jgi:hypothetical protein
VVTWTLIFNFYWFILPKILRIIMITTIKVEKSTAKKLKLSKIRYMGDMKLGNLTNDKYIMVLLGKNKK